MIALPKELQQALQAAGGAPVRVEDPETHAEYIVVSADEFESLSLASAAGGFSEAEQDYLLAEAARRAGWDDPEMDIYNDLARETEP
jgi:hypothetical protein